MVIGAIALSGCKQEAGESNEDAQTRADKVAVPGHDGVLKSTAQLRAKRRAYDGAPPVIPHKNFGMDCRSCHTSKGLEIPDVGFAPPMPHEFANGVSAMVNCKQCHVFQEAVKPFVNSTFVALRQDLRRGKRLNPFAPPVMPHPVFMRENCFACHSGPAAREEIRTTHSERTNCQQCHVSTASTSTFVRN